MMAAQKKRSQVLQLFFRISTYQVYAVAPEKPVRLADQSFYLAIVLCVRDHYE